MEKRHSQPPSALALIVVNLFPVFGVLYWGWSVFPIMLLFWAENVIIGFYNVLRMILCDPGEKGSWVMKFFLIPFFIVHYGGFTAAHGILVIQLFGQAYFDFSAGPRLDVLLGVIRDYRLFYALAALFLSHGYSFVHNYLGREEFRRYTLANLMALPYGRIVLLHISLLIGGILMTALDSPKAGLFLFILLKILMDLRAHRREHREKPSSPGMRRRRPG